MKIRTIFPLVLLAMQSALPGQDAASLMRKGEDALSAGIWEMAVLHFNECLASPGLTPAVKSQAAVRLAEAWIRDGKPADALDLLGRSFVTPGPEVVFWKGQALLGTGRFMESVETLRPLLDDPAAPHHGETAFTVANLLLSLGKPDTALDTLARLTLSPDAALAARARLHQVEILLDMGRTEDARKAMPPVASVSPADHPLATFLEAHLLLAEGRPADAASSFQALVDAPQGQSLQHYHAAAVGLADALRANGTPEAAADFLFSFIQEHPDSPQLEAMFRRLQQSLPATPSATDPVLERLSQWITPSDLPATGLIDTLPSDAVAAWPSTTTTNDLLAFSLHTRALGLHRCGTPEARAEALRLLTRLRLENPGHFLANRALFQTARWALESGSVDRAFCMLDALRETASSQTMRGDAAFIEARSTYQKGDRKKAIALFEEASRLLVENEARTARLNAAVIRLADNPDGSTNVALTNQAQDPSLTADLELERALATTEPAAKRKALGEFMSQHPDHPRLAEARLAAAEAAVAGKDPDLDFARAQLDALAADPQKAAAQSPARIAMVRLRIDDLSKNPAAAIATARGIITQFPADPAAADASLVLGRNLFQSRSYNDARLVLEKLAASDTDPTRAQAAWLLAARSAALVPTSQSQQEALILFDKAVAAKGPLAPVAMLEKARLMIDMNRLAEAAAFLRKWFDSLPPEDPLHLPAGLLLGEAVYAQGGTNPTSLTEALAVYDNLLARTKNQPAVFNRLQYLRGRTLEQIPDDKDPTIKREKQAFVAYYSVLETNAVPTEWHYFELCGFRALALLENAGRWPAAIACAKKIASFKGPRAEEAAARANQLQLKHMIWED